MKQLAFITFVVLSCAATGLTQPLDSMKINWWSPGNITSLPTTDSLSRLGNLSSLDLDFDHTLSLYQWSAGTQIRIPELQSLYLSPSVVLTVETRSKLREDTKTRTSEGAGFLGGNYPLVNDKLAATFSLFGTSYSLSNTASGSIYDIGTLQNLSDGYTVAGLNYHPSADFTFSAGGGLAYKSFLFGTSSGNIIQAKGVLNSIDAGDEVFLDASASLDERRFPSLGETMRNDGARIHLLTTFGEQGSNDLSAGITFRRRDFYFTVDSISPQARQERSEQVVELHNVLSYPLVLNRLQFILTGDFYPKSVSRTTSGIDFSAVSPSFLTSSTFLLPSGTSAFDLNLSGRLEWILPTTSGKTSNISAEWRFAENSEINKITLSELPFISADQKIRLSGIFDATSFDGQQSVMTLSGYFPLFSRDVLQTNVTSRLYRYDTPSKDNHDDRDELYLNASVSYLHPFSDRFFSVAQLRLSQNHLVYLASDRSAQNFSGKTISLQLAATYTSPLVRNAIAMEVFSNYSVYDFDLPQFEQVGGRDYLIRGLNGADSIILVLGKAPLFTNAFASIETDLNLRLYERGAYNAEAFSERPLLATTEFSGELTFNVADYSTGAPVLIKLGARTFYQLRSAPESIANTAFKQQEQVERIGPVATIIFDRTSASGLRLYTTVWYSILNHTIFSSNQPTSSTLVEGRLGVQWTF